MSYKQFQARMLNSLLPLLMFSTMACAQHSSMPPKSEDRPLEDRVTSMERAQREAWQKPDEVVKALDLKNHDIVADIGAGTGYFSRRLAQAVALDGKIYALGVAADILAYLKERDDRENIHNIYTIVSRPENPMLPANSVDLAFFCDTTTTLNAAWTSIASFSPRSKRMARWPSSITPRTARMPRKNRSN